MLLREAVMHLLVCAAAALRCSTRRAAVLGAAASLGGRQPPPVFAEDDKTFDLAAILYRAKNRLLTVDGVIDRARADKCDVLGL